MVSIVTIPAGIEVFVGAPRVPMRREVFKSIGKSVGAVRGVAEAHLPQCYAEGYRDPAAEVLVVVLDSFADRSEVLGGVAAALTTCLPEGNLDVWPLEAQSTLVPAVRRAGCQCYP